MNEPDKGKQNRFMGYQEAILDTYAAMSEEEKAELHAWEKVNLGNPDRPDVGTSDWLGWRKYLGPPPWKREDWRREN